MALGKAKLPPFFSCSCVLARDGMVLGSVVSEALKESADH